MLLDDGMEWGGLGRLGVVGGCVICAGATGFTRPHARVASHAFGGSAPFPFLLIIIYLYICTYLSYIHLS